MAIYTLRGDCGSIRAALRIIGGRVYSVDQSYQAYGAVSAMGAVRLTVASSEAASPPPDPDGCHTNSGAGRWRSFRGECSGAWSATRRLAYY